MNLTVAAQSSDCTFNNNSINKEATLTDSMREQDLTLLFFLHHVPKYKKIKKETTSFG